MAIQLDLVVRGTSMLCLFAYPVRDILWLRLLTTLHHQALPLDLAAR